MPDLSELIAAAVVRPGDHLLLALPEGFTKEDAERVVAMAEQRLPGVNVSVLAGCSGLAVRPAEPITTCPNLDHDPCTRGCGTTCLDVYDRRAD